MVAAIEAAGDHLASLGFGSATDMNVGMTADMAEVEAFRAADCRQRMWLVLAGNPEGIADAARTVGGKTDFTLASERLTIDTQEDIRGEQIEVYVPDVRWTLDMRTLEGRPVLLDQQQGRFDAPAIEITDGDGQNVSTSRNLSMNFDLTDVRTGGEGTQNNDSFRYQAD